MENKSSQRTVDELPFVSIEPKWAAKYQQVSDALICCICHELPLEPEEILCVGNCSRICCSHELKNWFQVQQKSTCPHCGSNVENPPSQPSRISKRRINSLEVDCPRDCKSKFTIGWNGDTLYRHLVENCPLMKKCCGLGDCKEIVFLKDLNTHQSNCEYRISKCEYCSQEMTFTKLKNEHYDPQVQCLNCMFCPNACTTEEKPTIILKSSLEQHKSKCPKQLIKCNFCDSHVLRINLIEHYKHSSPIHFQTISNQFEQLMNQMNAVIKDNIELKKNIDNMKQQVEVMKQKSYRNKSEKKNKDSEEKNSDLDAMDDLFARDEKTESKKEVPSRNSQKIRYTNFIIEVKPSDTDVDLDRLFQEIWRIKIEGVRWNNHQKLPIAFGVFKLRISCSINDDVPVESIIDSIMELSDVQSVDIIGSTKI